MLKLLVKVPAVASAELLSAIVLAKMLKVLKVLAAPAVHKGRSTQLLLATVHPKTWIPLLLHQPRGNQRADQRGHPHPRP